MDLVLCQKQLECYQHILKIKCRFVKIVFIYPLRFVKTHKGISKERSQSRTHGYSINLVINLEPCTFQSKLEKLKQCT